MKQKLKKINIIFLCIIIIFGLSGSVHAETLQNIQSYSDEEQIIIYIPNLKGKISSVSAQIGNEAVVDAQIEKIGKVKRNYIHTTILFDNSLSISVDNRDKMKEAAKELINRHVGGETFTLATFDTDVHEMSVNSKNYDELMSQIDSIEFINQDTYFKNVLYSVFEKNNTSQEVYQNYVIFSDGSDDNDVGYTYNEITNLLKDRNYPIYSIGSRYENNISALEEMFSISRAAKSLYFLLDEMDDMSALADQIIQDMPRNIARINIPEAAKDGSTKSIRLTIHVPDAEYSLVTEAKMPFANISAEEETSKENKPDKAAEAERQTGSTENVNKNQLTDEISSNELENEPEKETLPFYIILIGAAAIAGGAVLLVLIKGKKKTSTKNAGSGNTPETDPSEEEDDRTKPINNDESIINIRLTDIKEPTVMMEYSLSSSVILGRVAEKSQIVFDYEKGVSGKHCELSKSGNKVYIQDLQSLNGTYVNGKRITGKTELSTDSIIKLGRLQIRFQIINTNNPEEINMTETGTEFISDI